MKKITTILLIFITMSLMAQSNGRESWSFGLGLSNHIMAGDHRSIMTGLSDGADDSSPFNLGGYLYVDKMINPAFGLELKVHYSTMKGAAQEITGAYSVQGTNENLRSTYFEGTAMGAEVNAILNFSNMAARPYRTKARRWNIAGYFGMGIQSYDSKLYKNSDNSVLIDYGNNPSDDGIANSAYYTGAIGVKYKLTNNFDIELRPSVNLNEEDHLDAAVTNKQNLEIFFQTNLGLVFKINGKDNDNYVWQGKDFIEEVEEPDFNKLVDDAVTARLRNMPKPKVDNDYDRDGFNNDVDSCPLVYSKTNNGCPGDSDKDGVTDDRDLCPTVPGEKNNNGCPKPVYDTQVAQVTTQVYSPIKNSYSSSQPAPLGAHVYFDLNSSVLKYEEKQKLNTIALYMFKYPGAKYMLQGNTDQGGDLAYNQELSERRAKAVKKYLMDRGCNETDLEIIGYGETQQKFQQTEVNKLNRRVDVMLK